MQLAVQLAVRWGVRVWHPLRPQEASALVQASLPVAGSIRHATARNQPDSLQSLQSRSSAIGAGLDDCNATQR